MSRHDVYDVVVIVHVVVALVAFGSIALSGVYGMNAHRRARPGALEEVRRYFARPPRAEAAVLAVAALGVTAVLVDPKGRGLGQLWTMAALGLWVIASVLWVIVVRPAEVAIRRAAEGELTEAGGTDLDRHGARLARAGMASSVIFVLALGLMVFQPR